MGKPGPRSTGQPGAGSPPCCGWDRRDAEPDRDSAPAPGTQGQGPGRRRGVLGRDGENQPITPEQIEHGLGPEVIETLAARLGLPPGEASALLSKYLPQIIDKLTPHGTIEGVPTAPGA